MKRLWIVLVCFNPLNRGNAMGTWRSYVHIRTRQACFNPLNRGNAMGTRSRPRFCERRVGGFNPLNRGNAMGTTATPLPTSTPASMFQSSE